VGGIKVEVQVAPVDVEAMRRRRASSVEAARMAQALGEMRCGFSEPSRLHRLEFDLLQAMLESESAMVAALVESLTSRMMACEGESAAPSQSVPEGSSE
jgi:hypothetical protein